MINSSSPSIPLPEDIINATEAARNNVSILEAESGRFERLISSQKRELVSIEGQKADLLKQVDDLKASIEVLVEDLSTKNTERTTLLGDISEMEKELQDKRAEFALRSKELDERENDIDKAESKLQEGILRHTSDSIKLEEDKKAFNAKVDALNKVLSNI